jgi:hypothetical protein
MRYEGRNKVMHKVKYFNFRSVGRPPLMAALSAVAAGTLVLAAMPATAAPLQDPTGDFLSTYSGPHAGDLDVTSVDAHRDGQSSVTLTADLAGALGTTAGAAYVWGINRGAGVEPFPNFDPPTGQGVFFDAYVILSADGTGTLTDLLSGQSQALDPSSIHIEGSRISVDLAKSLMPTMGFEFGDYLYNFWPRFAPGGVVPTNNRQISDFAPDDSSFAAGVPEPASWAMMIAGFGAVGAGMRRRTRSVRFA